MVIAFAILYFVHYVLPFMAFISWIYRFTVIVRENEEKGMTVSFKKILIDTLARCYGFWIILVIYILSVEKTISGLRSSAFDIFFMSDGFPPGYFVIGCITVGLVYSYVFYKRHSR